MSTRNWTEQDIEAAEDEVMAAMAFCNASNRAIDYLERPDVQAKLRSGNCAEVEAEQARLDLAKRQAKANLRKAEASVAMQMDAEDTKKTEPKPEPGTITFRLDQDIDGTNLPRPAKYDVSSFMFPHKNSPHQKDTCFMIVKSGWQSGTPNEEPSFLTTTSYSEGMIVCEDYKYNCMHEIDFPASILVKDDDANLARAAKILDLVRQGCTARAYELREDPWILLRFGPPAPIKMQVETEP